MSISDTLLAANADGTLLEAVSALASRERKSVADLLATLHNSGEIDFLATCRSEELDRLSQQAFFPLHRVFCECLPKIDCSAAHAATACTRMFEKASTDLTAGLSFRALTEWFQRSPGRAEEGLTLIRDDTGIQAALVRPVLLAGATHDAKRFTAEAVELSQPPQSPIRLDALSVLGKIAPKDDTRLLKRVIERFGEVVDAPASDIDTATAIQAALDLLNRLGDVVVGDVENLLVNACKNPTPTVRRVLADGLRTGQNNYTDIMIDASFEAIGHTNKQDTATIREIDLLLYQYDLDADRKRVLELLQKLLSYRDDAIEIDQLKNFRHKLRDGSGEVLGWFVVSLLLTGDRRPCIAADRLLPYQQTCAGLDIDLGPFALGPSWIPFLARKILGYCLLKQESASALLLSCLRTVSDGERPELEELIMNHFLINYSTAIEWFETALSQDDPAKESVERLSASLKRYVDELSELGFCPAFAPSERERQLQRYRQGDFWRGVQEKANQHSILSIAARKATVLYGTAAIVYVYDKDNKGPHRKEIPFVPHEYKVEFPALDAIDPVGLSYVTYGFQLESPPS